MDKKNENLSLDEVRREVARNRRVLALYAISVLFIVFGVSVLLFLNVSAWMSQREAENHISEGNGYLSSSTDVQLAEHLEQAVLYNKKISQERVDQEVWPYQDQLRLDMPAPLMASYIEIPKIAVKLPIYHGTGYNELMAGIGHLEMSSLPIGGESSHCVLTGHSGMHNARMFDDLHQLEEGDRFVIWTLNEPYAYEVYSIETILPEEADGHLRIEKGRDLVTLITCTPYGINSHRLLVHAQRCDYSAEELPEIGVSAYVNSRSIPLMAVMGLLSVCGAVAVWRMLQARKRKKRNEEVLAKLVL